MNKKIYLVFSIMIIINTNALETIDIDLDKENNKFSNNIKEEVERKLGDYYSTEKNAVLNNTHEETNWIPISAKRDCSGWTIISSTEERRTCKIDVAKIQKNKELESNIILSNMEVLFETKEELVEETRLRELPPPPPPPPPPPQPITSCSSAIQSWGSCLSNIPTTNIGSERIVSNTNYGFIGNARFRCQSGGVWSYVSGTCGPLPTPPPPPTPTISCPSQTITWSSCSGTISTANANNSRAVTNSASGFTGNAVFSCRNNGTWMRTSGTCEPEKPPHCSSHPNPNVVLLCDIYDEFFSRWPDVAGATYWATHPKFKSASLNCKKQLVLNGAQQYDCRRYSQKYGKWPRRGNERSLPIQCNITGLSGYGYRNAIGYDSNLCGHL